MAGWSVADIPELKGKTIVITGANSGLGYEAALALAGRGAHVVLACRDQKKGADAEQQIKAAHPRSQTTLMALDLSSLADIRRFAAAATAALPAIDVLMNNAGVMALPHRTTADGFEMQLGTNHLGHFALTLGLLPLLRRARGRVTHQTSIAARRGVINWNDLNWESDYDPMRAYTQSKLAVALFARELDARSTAEDWGISSNLSHPGVSPTNLLAAQPGLGRERAASERRLIRALSHVGIAGTVDSAALPALRAATDPASRGDEFYGPRRTTAGAPTRQDQQWPPVRNMTDARRLWRVSEQFVGARFAA